MNAMRARASDHGEHAEHGERVQDRDMRTAKRAQMSADLAHEVDSYFFVGLGGDLSRGGVFVATWREIPIGDRVEIEVMLDDGPLRIEGTVRWAREPSAHAWPGLGVAFDDLDRADRERIEAFCEAHAPLYFELDDAAND